MLLAFTDAPIQLGTVLFKNRKPLGGQTVSVRVIDQKDGAELLPATVVPETAETGIYNFEWNRVNPNPPPINITDLQALFTVRNEVFPELIQLRSKTQNPSDFQATISDTEALKATVLNKDDLQATVEGDSLSASVTDDSLSATVTDEDTLKGEIPC